MNSIASLWAKEECPIFNGVIFGDGFAESIERCDQPRPSGVMTLRGQGRALLDSHKPSGLTAVRQLCRVEDNDKGIVVIGGECDMGGDGFVAVTDFADNLLWIAFFDFSNPFVSVKISGDDVVARNNHGETWCFPLATPSQIKIEVPSCSEI